MRRTALLVAAAAVAGCVPQTAPAPQVESRLRAELAGRVAGEPEDCLPYSHSGGVTAIGDTILFRNGRRIWLSRSEGGGCSALEASNYTLVTRSFGPGRLCEGDLGRVVDLTTGAVAGSCVLGPFVPYTRP